MLKFAKLIVFISDLLLILRALCIGWEYSTTGNTNLELFAQRCRAIAEPIIGKQIKNISIGNLLAQLFKITEEFGMETQPQLLLLQKTVVVVEGIGQSLDPEINMWQLAEPWIKKWAAKNLTPEAKLLRIAKKFINRIAEDL